MKLKLAIAITLLPSIIFVSERPNIQFAADVARRILATHSERPNIRASDVRAQMQQQEQQKKLQQRIGKVDSENSRPLRRKPNRHQGKN